MRKKLFDIIKPNAIENRNGRVYDYIMIVAIVISILPLFFRGQYHMFYYTEKITVGLFIIDYLIRWITADYLFDKKGIIPFLIYPFSLKAIIDILSILPAIVLLHSGFKAFRIVRLMWALKVLTVFRSFRYSKNIAVLIKVVEKEKDNLITVFGLAAGYVVVSALVMYQVEPQMFNNFFDATYWAVILLTTVGYGDICPVTVVGRIITMFSTFIGIAVVALPTGLITAGYLDELKKNE